MNKEHMARMGADELDRYARSMGFSAKAGKTAEEKARIIERKRGRAAKISVIGVEVEVPVKRLHDKRVTDLLAKREKTDEETAEMIRLIVGDEAWDELVKAATEEDDTVDNDALGFAIASIITSRELKNY